MTLYPILLSHSQLDPMDQMILQAQDKKVRKNPLATNNHNTSLKFPTFCTYRHVIYLLEKLELDIKQLRQPTSGMQLWHFVAVYHYQIPCLKMKFTESLVLV